MQLDITKIKEIELPDLEVKEKLDKLQSYFSSKVIPKNGFYGISEIVRDNGIIEKISKNMAGHIIKEYLTPERIIFQSKENLGNEKVKSILYDTNGNPYLERINQKTKDFKSVTTERLFTNIKIIKDNFTSVTDIYGRPILNKIEDLQIKSGNRESINIDRNKYYRPDDQRGHIIADIFGGPATLENIIPQLDAVNLSLYKQFENYVKNLKTSDNKVDYEVAVKYALPSNKRPSSLEPKVWVNGKEVEIPDEFKKIYNSNSQGFIEKSAIGVGETVFSQDYSGLKNAIIRTGINFARYSAENISLHLKGEISAEDIVPNILKDAVKAGALEFGVEKGEKLLRMAMKKSSLKLIQKIGELSPIDHVLDFALDSYNSLESYSSGEIDYKELAYDIGESATINCGLIAKDKALGVINIGADIVGDVIATAILSKVYRYTVVNLPKETIYISNKIQEYAGNTLAIVDKYYPDKLEFVKDSFNNYFEANNMPFKV